VGLSQNRIDSLPSETLHDKFWWFSCFDKRDSFLTSFYS